MPFGQYKGMPLSEVDSDYLEWVLTIARPALRAAVEAELHRRDALDAVDAAAPDADTLRAAEQIVQLGFRQVAQRCHPDVGGTDTAMRHALQAREWLTATLTTQPLALSSAT